MDNDHSICQRLAMMLDEDPSCTILIIGRYMAPVRAEYNSVRHLVRQAPSNDRQQRPPAIGDRAARQA